jgi:hypothetical protein
MLILEQNEPGSPELFGGISMAFWYWLCICKAKSSFIGPQLAQKISFLMTGFSVSAEVR